MKHRRQGRALRGRYGKRKGHALPLLLVPVAKFGSVAIAKLRSAELAERAVAPLVSGAKGAWGWVAGRRSKKGKKALHHRYGHAARRSRGGWWVHWSNGSENGPFDSRVEAKHYADYWHGQGVGTFKLDQVPGWDERMGPRPARSKS